MRAFFLSILLIFGLGLPVEAQAPDFVRAQDTLSSNGDSFVVPVRGYASARIQTLDSYSGTWEVQCSVDDGTTYDTDDEVNLSLEGSSNAAVQAVTDTVGIWIANVAACTHIKVIATAGFAASDTVVAVAAVVSGGGAGAAGSSTVSGGLTNDNAAATSNRLATLPGITETSAPSRTNGRDAALSMTAGGAARVMVTDAAGAALSLATDATHDSAASSTGPQVMVGATSTYATAVTSGDAARMAAGLDAIAISRPHAHVGDFVKGYLANTDGASTAVVAAQGAGIKFCATSLIVSNSSATNVTVDIRDGTAGSVIATFPASANMGGAAHVFQVPLCTSANTALAMDASAAVTTVAVTAVGFRTAQ